MKQITIDGRVGKDAQVLKTQGGRSYIRFSLANDTFVNGANKTEWYDVTSFDQFIIEKRANFITKGRYIIVSGIPDTKVTTKDGRLFLNQYVTANSIEFPSIGGKKEDNNSDAQVSTFTGGTKSETMVQETKATPAPQVTQPAATPQPVQAAVAASGLSDDSDLPF